MPFCTKSRFHIFPKKCYDTCGIWLGNNTAYVKGIQLRQNGSNGCITKIPVYRLHYVSMQHECRDRCHATWHDDTHQYSSVRKTGLQKPRLVTSVREHNTRIWYSGTQLAHSISASAIVIKYPSSKSLRRN